MLSHQVALRRQHSKSASRQEAEVCLTEAIQMSDLLMACDPFIEELDIDSRCTRLRVQERFMRSLKCPDNLKI